MVTFVKTCTLRSVYLIQLFKTTFFQEFTYETFNFPPKLGLTILSSVLMMHCWKFAYLKYNKSIIICMVAGDIFQKAKFIEMCCGIAVSLGRIPCVFSSKRPLKLQANKFFTSETCIYFAHTDVHS